MKIKTNELTGAALDWAVAKCEGWQQAHVNGNPATGFLFKRAEPVTKMSALSFSTDWSQGGPIIEREKIRIEPVNGWQAGVTANGIYWTSGAESPTPLIASMRCYVASKLGDEVEIPEELT